MNLGPSLADQFLNQTAADPTFVVPSATPGLASTGNQLPSAGSTGLFPDSGTGSTYNAAAAQAAAAQAVHNAAVRQQAQTAQQGIMDAGRVAVNTLEGAYQDKTLPFARSVEQGQQNINQSRVSNALGLRRSQASISQGVRQGVRSGGVQLANMNALDSGAAGALAQAYAKQGGNQLNQARNSEALAEQQLNTTQGNLDTQKSDTLASLLRFKSTEADRIYHDTMQKLADLNAQTATQGVAGAVDVHGQDAIVNDALHRLDLLDQALQSRLSAAAPLNSDQIQAQAVANDQAGMAANPFAYDPTSVVTPGGAPQTQVPLFAKPKDDQTQPLALSPS